MRKLPLLLLAALGITAACTGGGTDSAPADGGTLVVTTSSIVEHLVEQIAGSDTTVVSLIPNGFDSHTYEPRPSELELLGQADLIVMADRNLNSGITGLIELSGDTGRILDLNAAALTADQLIRRDGSNGTNPHTWTDPTLVIAWLDPLTERLDGIAPGDAATHTANSETLRRQIETLDRDIEAALSAISDADRKLVVYHDAWEYFGRRYDLDVVGALQAVNFAEPSAQEIEAMAAQIRDENVAAFFGSEVFPSDVMQALQSASGARYIADLADDRLIGEPGDTDYGYVPLMRANLTLLLDGLQQ